MKISSLTSNEINQNGYHINKLTRNKIGFIYTAPVNIVPDDCLACDGYVLKITDYKKLHSVIGTLFNTGEEAEDEFRIPDYNITGKFLQPGINVGTKLDAGLPNITGSFGYVQNVFNSYFANGAFVHDRNISINDANAGVTTGAVFNFDASRSSAVFGKSSTVQPSSQIVHLCIKYK